LRIAVFYHGGLDSMYWAIGRHDGEKDRDKEESRNRRARDLSCGLEDMQVTAVVVNL